MSVESHAFIYSKYTARLWHPVVDVNDNVGFWRKGAPRVGETMDSF